VAPSSDRSEAIKFGTIRVQFTISEIPKESRLCCSKGDLRQLGGVSSLPIW